MTRGVVAGSVVLSLIVVVVEAVVAPPVAVVVVVLSLPDLARPPHCKGFAILAANNVSTTVNDDLDNGWDVKGIADGCGGSGDD